MYREGFVKRFYLFRVTKDGELQRASRPICDMYGEVLADTLFGCDYALNEAQNFADEMGFPDRFFVGIEWERDPTKAPVLGVTGSSGVVGSAASSASDDDGMAGGAADPFAE